MLENGVNNTSNDWKRLSLNSTRGKDLKVKGSGPGKSLALGRRNGIWRGDNLAFVHSVFAGSSVLGHGWARMGNSAFLTINTLFFPYLILLYVPTSSHDWASKGCPCSSQPTQSQLFPRPPQNLSIAPCSREVVSAWQPAEVAPLPRKHHSATFASRSLYKSLQTLSGCSSSTQEGWGSVPTQSNALVASSTLLPSKQVWVQSGTLAILLSVSIQSLPS